MQSLDYAASHVMDVKLLNIKLTPLHPNMSSNLRPLDAGASHNFDKTFCLKLQTKYHRLCIENGVETKCVC